MNLVSMQEVEKAYRDAPLFREVSLGIDEGDRIGLVGFYDTAFVGADRFDFDQGDWQSGAGLGLRYDTGIGPIRLDVAVPTSGPDAGERLHLDVGIGQSF